MNKPLLAAITGVAFGVTLTSAIVFTRSHSRQQRHCPHSSFIVQRTIIQPDRPLPQVSVRIEADDLPASACPRLVDHPLDQTDMQLSQAQAEYVHGNYACAQALAEKVMDKNPVRAFRIMGASACLRHDLPTVKLAAQHLDAAGRQYLVYVCNRSGVNFGKRGPVLAE